MSAASSPPANDDGDDGHSLGFEPQSEGPYSAEKILERTSYARDQVSKESNRFFIISLIFSGLAIVKMADLNIAPTILGIRTENVQYGLFFFIVASQVCSIMSILRVADSRALSHQIEVVTRSLYPAEFKKASKTFANVHEWTGPSQSAIIEIRKGGLARFLYNLAMLFTSLLALFVIFVPTILGGFYVHRWEFWIKDGNIDLQYYAVASTTVLSILWFLSYFALHYLTEIDDPEVSGGD